MRKLLYSILILAISLPLFAQTTFKEMDDRYFRLFRKDKTEEHQILLDAKIKYERSYPVFSQKAGMLRPNEHSTYFRTDDEITGFSTCFLGYRYAVNEYFNIGFEGGASILPQSYLLNLLLHFKLLESPNKLFFLGLRSRTGYKYQDMDLSYLGLGDNYLKIFDRHSLIMAFDLTAAFRFGIFREQALYYTIISKFDFDLMKWGNVDIYFSPIMAGYEIRFGKRMAWSFAIESGYTFPVPWNSVPEGKWVNFPSLANVGLHYRFGNPFYNKSNMDKIISEGLQAK